MAKKKPQQTISKELKDEQLNTIIGGVSMNGTSSADLVMTTGISLVNIVQTTLAPQRFDEERDNSLRNVSRLQAESAIQKEENVVHPEVPLRK